VTTVAFAEGDATQMRRGELGTFDAVLVLGLVYHLEDPIGALRAARSHTGRLCIVETQVAPGLSGRLDWGSPRWTKAMEGSFALVDESDELRGRNMEANTSSLSLVPSLDALLHVMRAVGFDRVEVLEPVGDNDQLVNGKRVMVAGWVD
jgi:hypothetical protein